MSKDDGDGESAPEKVSTTRSGRSALGWRPPAPVCALTASRLPTVRTEKIAKAFRTSAMNLMHEIMQLCLHGASQSAQEKGGAAVWKEFCKKTSEARI